MRINVYKILKRLFSKCMIHTASYQQLNFLVAIINVFEDLYFEFIYEFIDLYIFQGGEMVCPKAPATSCSLILREKVKSLCR